MSVFKRLTATISSRIDHLVGEIENHDAVVEATIRDARKAVARSKVRLARLKCDGVKLKRKHAELGQAESRWENRARREAGKNEDRALECLRRRQECRKQIQELAEVLSKHTALEARLDRDIRSAETKVAEMTQQRNTMRSRQSAAEALNSISDMDESMVSDLSGAFERWEIKVTEAELEAGTSDIGFDDAIEREYMDADEREALKAELAELVADKESSDERK